jgi:membrane-bound lytic murein transglycosylase B
MRRRPFAVQPPVSWPSARARMRGALCAALILPLGGCIGGDAFAERGDTQRTGSIQAASLDVSSGNNSGNSTRPSDFSAYIESLRPQAERRGVSRATFDRAFAGVTPDQEVVRLTQRQPEFARPIWEYLDGAVSSTRIRLGNEARSRHGQTLAAVERAYGVPQAIVLGIWGMETNFGGYKGSKDVFRSLATLAHQGHRGDFFQGELLAALEILQEGKISRDAMKGSWAGAMGHPQFMPTSYLRFAADGNGDGRRDIWNSVPDALASAANYLREHGWQPGLPWGMEVRLPSNFDYGVEKAAFGQWAQRGVRPAAGGSLPNRGEASLFQPAGSNGPAFLVTANYDVIKRYNSSDAYALGVALLGDRLTGGAGVQASWPRNEPRMNTSQREELQRRLRDLGYYSGDIDGMFGSMTREAVRNFQRGRGLPADGYANMALLETLRASR